MDTFSYFVICVLVISPVSAHKSMQTDDDVQQGHSDACPDLKQKLLDTQEKILNEIKETKFYQYITVEFYQNGAVKQITRSSDWRIILTLGAFSVVAGGVSIYFIGPVNIIHLMKLSMESKVVAAAAKMVI